MRFVDTNVLIYAVSGTAEDAAKRSRALDLLSRHDLGLSVQVLQEFYVQATRTTRTGALTHGEAVDFVASMLRFRVQETTHAVLRTAFGFRERYALSYWDCAILAAARILGCDVVFSEDLSAEQDYDGLRVVDPFA